MQICCNQDLDLYNPILLKILNWICFTIKSIILQTILLICLKLKQKMIWFLWWWLPPLQTCLAVGKSAGQTTQIIFQIICIIIPTGIFLLQFIVFLLQFITFLLQLLYFYCRYLSTYQQQHHNHLNSAAGGGTHSVPSPAATQLISQQSPALITQPRVILQSTYDHAPHSTPLTSPMVLSPAPAAPSGTPMVIIALLLQLLLFYEYDLFL